jgi:hypothetical protein
MSDRRAESRRSLHLLGHGSKYGMRWRTDIRLHTAPNVGNETVGLFKRTGLSAYIVPIVAVPGLAGILVNPGAILDSKNGRILWPFAVSACTPDLKATRQVEMAQGDEGPGPAGLAQIAGATVSDGIRRHRCRPTGSLQGAFADAPMLCAYRPIAATPDRG